MTDHDFFAAMAVGIPPIKPPVAPAPVWIGSTWPTAPIRTPKSAEPPTARSSRSRSVVAMRSSEWTTINMSNGHFHPKLKPFGQGDLVVVGTANATFVDEEPVASPSTDGAIRYNPVLLSVMCAFAVLHRCSRLHFHASNSEANDCTSACAKIKTLTSLEMEDNFKPSSVRLDRHIAARTTGGAAG